jgi:gliding motility-associated-like protein
MVWVNPNPEVHAGEDASYNVNDAIFITALGSGTMTWINGENISCRECPQTQIYPTHSGCYVVETRNEEGCTASDDICIDLTEDFTIYVPNSFSPNNDGINDVFLVFGENISDVSMEIYDRWGAKIFYSGDYRTGWDGKFKDTSCPSDTYTYLIRYKGVDRKSYTKTGNVNLIR